MSVHLVCPHGHSITVDEAPRTGPSSCPECGAPIPKTENPPQAGDGTDETPIPAHGLWSLMHRKPPAESETAEPDAEENHARSGGPADEETPGRARLRGLWDVMRHPADETDTIDSGFPSATDTIESAESPPAPASEPHATDDEPPDRDDERHAGHLPERASFESESHLDETISPSLQSAEPTPRKPAGNRNATASLALGLLSIPLAFLALRPELWLKFPALLAGFAAIATGLPIVSAPRRRHPGRSRAVAAAGIVLGVAGMFLGPLVFSRIGAAHRISTGRDLTQQNLGKIGNALRTYEKAHGTFPPGTLTGSVSGSPQTPLHSWTTALLPYLGEEQLRRAIDLARPFDDPANAPAMQRDVPAFFAAGSPRDKTPRGFAVTHFAGVGGDSGLGIFTGTTGLKRAEIADGLSQTLVAGEIASAFPPWGEPDNVRAIGRGLNREYAGFGNADGSGAMFLRADGSVRFYATGTDPEILRRLSTRDAGDVVPESFR